MNFLKVKESRLRLSCSGCKAKIRLNAKFCLIKLGNYKFVVLSLLAGEKNKSDKQNKICKVGILYKIRRSLSTLLRLQAKSRGEKESN